MDHFLNVCFEFCGFLKSVEFTYYIHRSERDKKSRSRMAYLFSTWQSCTCAFEDSSWIKSLISWFHTVWLFKLLALFISQRSIKRKPEREPHSLKRENWSSHFISLLLDRNACVCFQIPAKFYQNVPCENFLLFSFGRLCE